MKKKNNKKGFTLAELLIVVAIIAVLTAIAIPVFSSQLEKAREGTDLANIRSMYAEAALAVLNGTTAADTSSITGGAITATKDTGNKFIQNVTIEGFKPNQLKAGWLIDVSNVAGVDISSYQPVKGTDPVKIKFTFNEDGKMTAISAAT